MSGKEGEKAREMPTVWDSLKKSFQNCKSEPTAATEPRPKRNLCGSACSRSLSNLRDVIHGSKRHTDCGDDDDDNKPPPSYSPRSLGSSDFLNPVSHDVVLSDSTSELKITALHGKVSPATLVSTIKSGNEGGFDPLPRRSTVNSVGNEKPSRLRTAPDVEPNGASSPLTCKKCSVQFKKVEDVEEHQVSEHAVTELAEGDSSRQVVEIICRTNDTSIRMDRVLKVNNTKATLSRFEEHRETVKTKATKLPTKHPRCLADGNELLRFHGTNVSCPLGTNTKGSSSSSSSFVLCTMDECGVCQILRHGFSKREETGNVGIFTASTSKKALEKASSSEVGRNALVLCRVIAGRVHKPVDNIQEVVNQSGFDSLAGKFGQHSSVEELYLFNPKALLPCFVVIL